MPVTRRNDGAIAQCGQAPAGQAPTGRIPAPSPDRTAWSPALVERLVALWNEGESAARIATRLGLSRNAVIGKVYRLQLCRRNAAVTAERLAAQAEARRRRAIHGLCLKVRALQAADPVGEGTAGAGMAGEGMAGAVR